MGQGLKRDQCLEIVGLTKNQLYYRLKGTKPGRGVSTTTEWRDPTTLIHYEVDNRDVVQKIIDIKLNPDHTNWYRMIAVTLAIMGYYINHKKVYRLMQEYVLLEPPRKKTGRNFVQYRQISTKRTTTSYRNGYQAIMDTWYKKKSLCANGDRHLHQVCVTLGYRISHDQ